MPGSVILDIRAVKEETPEGGSIEGERGKSDVRVEDEILILRVAEAGDDRSLSELYDRYSGMVYGMGLRHLGDRSLAEDLVQEVFTSVWRKARSFDPSKASFITWVYQISRNRTTDLARKRRSRPTSAGSESLTYLPGSDDVRGVAENIDVAEALSLLAPEHQEVLVLSYFEGLTQREIALTTGVPLGTIKSRTTAALKVLRKVMLSEEEDDDG